KVYVVRAKKVTGWVPEFGKENSDESEDYSDNNSVGKKNWVESEEGEIIPESVQNDAFIDNIAEFKPINGDSRENQSAHEMNDSNLKFPSGFTPQHLNHYEYEKVEALRESTTPQDSKKVRNDQTFHQVLEESVNKSSGVSKTAHTDFMAGPVKQQNGFSILERFQEFIDIGQAMGYKMKGAWGSEEKAVGKETLSFESVRLVVDHARLKEWSSIKRRNKDHNRKVIQDSLIEIDLRLDKGNGLPDDLTKRANLFRLRHGDPLSPFLFILVMESLHVSFQRLIDRDDRKITWVCWNKVLAYKNKDGLGVNSLYALNLASIFKWIWRLLASSSSLWIKVIKSIHGNSGALDNPYSSRLKNSTWIGILKAINKLKEKFKRLFNLKLQKYANVASKLQASNVASSFRRPPRSAEALRDADWVSAMQEEFDQFARLKVWRLVPRPEGKSIIKSK
nr:RNA-directed DNA polymerase, eukaryota, reverse transcriptase zinc-binding domain protein [Tanacetum cinerariifolium]